MAQNTVLVNDGTPYFRQSQVKIEVGLPISTDIKEWEFSFILIPDTALKLINRVIEVYRDVGDKFAVQTIASPDQLFAIQYQILNPETCPNLKPNGVCQRYPGGGIRPLSPDLDTNKLQRIKALLLSKGQISLSRKLFLDARLYQMKKDNRMALINLVLSLELFLAELANVHLHTIKANTLLTEDKINSWTMYELATKGIKAITGYSLENSSYWGQSTVDKFRQILRLRNEIMHRGSLTLRTKCNDVLNLNDETVLNQLFQDVEGLKERISQVIDSTK